MLGTYAPTDTDKLIPPDQHSIYWPSDANYSDEVSLGPRTDATIIMDKKQNLFTWDNLKFSVNGKQILKGVSGSVSGGQLVAVMGSSGAGKTTLMNILSGRFVDSNSNLPSDFQGKVTYSDMVFDLSSSEHRTVLKNVSGQVKQHDVLCATATTKESIEFAAELRLPQHLSKENKMSRIDEILYDLKLTECADTVIGDEYTRGLSGGEKKRVSVGIELLTDPQLLFLDEPISGLDSNTAKKLLRILKNLSKSGKQIFLTIHQPSSEIFSMFDQLLLMSRGQCVYFGAACNVIHYFKLLGYQCGNYVNPADFILDAINDDPEFFINAWEKFDGFYNTTVTTNSKGVSSNTSITIDKSSGKHLPTVDEDAMSQYRYNYPSASFGKQIKLLLIRDLLGVYRNPDIFVKRLINCVLTTFLLGLVYWNLPKTERGTQDMSHVLYWISSSGMVVGITNAVMIFPVYRILYEHERSVNTYSTTAYLLVKIIWTTPLIAIEAMITAIILVSMTRINGSIFEYFLVIFVSSVSYGAIGMFISCFANKIEEAVLLPPFCTPMSIFNNLSVDMNRIFACLGWFRWVNVTSYMLDMLHHIAFVDYEFQMGFAGVDYGSMSGEQYLEYLGIGSRSMWFNFGMICVIMSAFWIFTWIILVKRNGI